MQKKITKLTAVMLGIGGFVSAYLGYLVNGAWRKGMNVMEFMDAFNQVCEKPFANYWSSGTIKACTMALVIYVMVLLMYFTSRRNYMHGKEFGTAKYANVEQINRILKDKDESRNRILSQNLRMSLDTRKTKLNNNELIIGGSGAGKTFYVVKPNIMQLANKGSFICTDPKGEILRATGEMLKKNGYQVRVLNLIDMDKSDCYNPFRYIRDENDVVKLVNNIINNTTPKESSTQDPFWDKAESMFLQALFYYVWLEKPINERNFQSVLELISMAEVKQKDEDSDLTKLMKKLAEKSELKESHPAYKQYMKVVKGAGDTVRSIIISANSRLALLENSKVLRVLSKDEMYIEELGIGRNGDEETKTALFCVIPDSDKSYNFIVGMLYTQLFQELYFQADFNYNGRLPLHVTLMMDEFANVALPDDFCSLLSTMRSREISAIIIIQNLAQIKALFKDTWETIPGNCDTLIYLGGNEQSTHKYISELLGKGTIDKKSTGDTRGVHGSASRNYDVIGRELMTADEARKFDNKKCLVFIRGFDPIMDNKYVPMNHKHFNQTADGKGNKYEHEPNLDGAIFREIEVLGEKSAKYFQMLEKRGENVKVIDMKVEQFMLIGDDDFKERFIDKSEEENEDSGNKPIVTITYANPKEELSRRLFNDDYSDKQIEEIGLCTAANVPAEKILEYLQPGVTVKQLKQMREDYVRSIS